MRIIHDAKEWTLYEKEDKTAMETQKDKGHFSWRTEELATEKSGMRKAVDE